MKEKECGCVTMTWSQERVRQVVCRQDRAQHDKEWMVEQKSRVVVRNRIRREFEAMVRREREMRQKVVRQGKHVAKLEQEEEKQVVAITRRSPAEEVKEVKEAEVKESVTTNTEDTEAVTRKNFHGEQCRTCVRMRSIMGDILPHPINV